MQALPLYCEAGSLANQKPFLSFVVDEELLRRLDDFRFENRFASRAAAIKWLLRWALDRNPKPEPDRGEPTEGDTETASKA